MSQVLFRVDERLIHGQVVVAWARSLEPDRIIVVDDLLADNEIEQEIYEAGLPPDLEATFLNESEAVSLIPAVVEGSNTVIVLTKDLATMHRLFEAGVPIAEINIGGIHAAEGRRRVLPYVCLDGDDERRIRQLEDAGVTVAAKDLPTTTAVRLVDSVG